MSRREVVRANVCTCRFCRTPESGILVRIRAVQAPLACSEKGQSARLRKACREHHHLPSANISLLVIVAWLVNCTLKLVNTLAWYWDLPALLRAKQCTVIISARDTSRRALPKVPSFLIPTSHPLVVLVNRLRCPAFEFHVVAADSVSSQRSFLLVCSISIKRLCFSHLNANFGHIVLCMYPTVHLTGGVDVRTDEAVRAH